MKNSLFNKAADELHDIYTVLGIKFKFLDYKKLRKLRETLKQQKSEINISPDIPLIINNVAELLGYSTANNRDILRKNLTQIEIELFSYCNRQCWFCPNSFIDRHSSNIFMDEYLYLNILKQLSEIDYSNVITYSRYNEPLSQKEFFLKSIKLAREYCPKALIRTNSNGDFLTSIEYRNERTDAGLNELSVQCYLNENEVFSVKTFEEKTQKFAKRFNLNYHIENHDKYSIAYFDYEKLKLTYSMYDFKNMANNRGETLSQNIKPYTRTASCIVPFQHLYIDYNGDVMLCCNLRHDVKEHQKFIIGNVMESSLADIFQGEKIINYRRLLACNGEKISPCNTCRFFTGYERVDLCKI